MIAAYVFVIFVGVAVWLEFQTPLYQGVATVLVDPTRVTNQAEKQSLENLALQATLISSPGILNKVLETYNLTAIYPFNKSASPTALLQSRMTVKPNIKSKTIEVAFLFNTAEEAAKIANAIASAYVYSSEEKSQGTTQDSLASLQLNILQETEKQEKVKKKIDEFKKQYPEIEDEDTLNKQIDFFNAELTKADSGLIALRTKTQEIEQYQKETGSIYNHPYIMENEIIARQLERIRVAEGSLEELKNQYREMHPDVIAAQARLDSLKKIILQDAQQVFQQFQMELKTRESTRQRLRDELDSLKTKIKSLDPQKIKLKALMDEADASDKTIKLIQERMSVPSVEGGLKRAGVEILNLAKPVNQPYWPNKPKMLVAALVFGLISGLGSIFLYCYFDQSIRTHDDVEEVAGKIFLGDLNYAKVSDGDLYPQFPDDKSFILFTHGLRLITTNIEFVLSDQQQKCVLFTSSVPGEGKSFVSFHVAQSMARQGKRVILVDADFCQSSLRDKVPRGECEQHLYEYLSGMAEASDIIEKTDNDLMDFIRSGSRSAFSSPQALKSKRMRDLLAALKASYDYVLIDTPPVLAVNDTLAVSQFVDMRVIIVKWASTNRALVRKAIAKIAPGQLIMAGVVLNQVKEMSEKGYHIYRPN